MNNKILTKLTITLLSFFLTSPAMENENVPDKIYDEEKESKIIFATIELEPNIELQNRRNLESFSKPTPLTFFLPQCAHSPTKNLFAAIVNRRIELANPNTQKSYSCFILPYKGAKHSAHKQEHKPLCIAFSPDGATIAGGYEHTYQSHLPVPTIQIYNTQKGHQIKEFGDSNDYVHSLAYNQDGRLLASGSEHGKIIIWNLNKLSEGFVEKETTLNKNNIQITSLIFSPNNTKLISASENQEINIWDLLTKACITTLTTQADVKALAFHPTKDRLIAFLRNREIYFWNNICQKYLENQ